MATVEYLQTYVKFPRPYRAEPTYVGFKNLHNFFSRTPHPPLHAIVFQSLGHSCWSKRMYYDFGAAGGQNSVFLYQMSTFSYWNLHLQSLKSKKIAPAAGWIYPPPHPQPPTEPRSQDLRWSKTRGVKYMELP